MIINEEVVLELLTRIGRMTINQMVEKINTFGFDVVEDLLETSAIVAELEYHNKVGVSGFGPQKYDPLTDRPFYEPLFKVL